MAFELPKAFPMPHLNAVMAVAGPVYAAPLLFSDLALATGTYDGLKANVAEAAQFALARFGHLHATFPDQRFAAVIAGLSEAHGLDAYVIHNDERLGEPWQVIDLGAVAMVPGDASTQAAFAAAFPGVDADDLHPVRDGIRMLEIQRQNPAHGIGGFAQLTTVTRAGISTRIIHRWAETPSLGVSNAA